MTTTDQIIEAAATASKFNAVQVLELLDITEAELARVVRTVERISGQEGAAIFISGMLVQAYLNQKVIG